MKARILNFNVQDETGDVFTKESVSSIKKNLPMRINFKGNIVEKVSTHVDKDGVIASIPDGFKGSGLYPAIGFRKKGEKIEIYEVSLCANPNADSTIKPL